jgi:excisionase family DNA binding protein
MSQAVEYTGLTRQRINTLIKQGKLPAERIGRQVLIKKSMLSREILRKNVVNTNSCRGIINTSSTGLGYKTCDSCGKRVSNNDTFCLNCGNETEE